MKNFLLLVALILLFVFDNVFALSDVTTDTICRIVNYTHGIGGPMITIVIIGASLLAIFGRMPWPALFALGTFTAVFFGAPILVSKIVPNTMMCKDGETSCPDGSSWNKDKITCVKH